MKLQAILLSAAMSFAAAPAMAACPTVTNPVCALDNGARVQFDNSCKAQVKGAKVLHEGQCAAPGAGPMMCSMIYQPVCAGDANGAQKTFPNLCHAEVAAAPVLHNGACAGR